MQTIKTAFVVLLLMTVAYGCYVSLTAQPEPLPAEVANLMVEGDFGDMSIEDGLPEAIVDPNAKPSDDLGPSFSFSDSSQDPSTPAAASDPKLLTGGPAEAITTPQAKDGGGQSLLSDAGSASSTPIASSTPLGATTPIGVAASTPIASSTPIPGSTPNASATSGLGAGLSFPDPQRAMAPSAIATADPAIPASTPIGETIAGSAEPVAGIQLPKSLDAAAAGAPEAGGSQANQGYPSTQTASLTLPDPQSLANLSSGAEPSANQAASWNSDVSKQAAADRGAAGGFALPPLPGGSPSDPSGGSQTTPAAMAAGAMAAGALAASATQGTPGQPTQSGLVNAVQQADRQFAADQPAQALATLSLFYHTPGITESDRAALLSRLDPLAGIVIYSRRHMLEQPHRVGQSETLMEVAARYEIPWQLLANINAIEDPVTVLPGTELKVVRGPFRGEVDLTRSELTIFLGDLYAGRFPIKVNNEAAPAEGTYTVLDKQNSQTFYDKDGSPIAPEDPRNPYGNLWIDLGQKLCIHGSPNPGDFSPAGCISLRGRDAGDLMGILSQGSAITVRR